MKLSTILTALITAGIAISFSGCANKKGKNQYAGVDGDYVNGTPLPERQEGVSFMNDNVDKSRFKPVHFSFDSYAIEASERPGAPGICGGFSGFSTKCETRRPESTCTMPN